MNNGHWALAQEIIRHVVPFLGLSLDELKVLEAVHNVSTRQQSFHGSLSIDDLKTALPDDQVCAFGRLHELRILLPASEPDTHIPNLYGLLRFYLLLSGKSSPRKITRERLAKVEKLLEAVQRDFGTEKLALIDLGVPVPELLPRKTVRVGRTVPVMDTVLKHRLTEASMQAAIDHLKTYSEFTVFMRCINMTLERNVITCPVFSIDRVHFGHAPRGSLGLPMNEKSIRSALKRLEAQGLISISRPYSTSKTGQLSINAPGVAAIHARDHRSIRAYELFLTTWDLVKYLDVNLAFRFDRILDTSISDIMTKLSYTHRDLHLEIQTALGTPPRKVRVTGHWSDGSCPTAAETHMDGTDDEPSFGILIDDDGSILYNCWACQDGEVRPISYLFSRIAETFEFPHKAHRICISASKLVRMGAIQIPEFERPEVISTGVLKKYPCLTRYAKDGTGYLKKYLQYRGVTPDAYEHFRVRYIPPEDVKSRVPKTLVTEFTNPDGTVVALRLRSPKAKGRQFTTIGSFGSSMFGLAQADVNRPPLVVEGEIDAECCFSHGFTNVVAIGGATRKTSLIADVIRRWSNQTVYLGLDCDSAGQEAQERLIEVLKADVPDLHTLDWSSISLSAPIHTDTGARNTCKDAADIPTKEQFWSAIRNARLVGSRPSAAKRNKTCGAGSTV
jgi:hypothetical protein